MSASSQLQATQSDQGAPGNAGGPQPREQDSQAAAVDTLTAPPPQVHEETAPPLSMEAEAPLSLRGQHTSMERQEQAAQPAAAPTPASPLQVRIPSDEEEAGPPSPAAEVSFSPPAQPEADRPAARQQAHDWPRALSPSGLRASTSPGEARSAKAASRRQQAAEWVAALTGCAVPPDSDAAFRASLRDGVTLCRLANVLRPGSVGRVIDYTQECSSPTGEVIKSFENVANFIAAVKETLGDADACLSTADLEDVAERPAVTDCLLALQAWWLAQQARSRPVSPVAASPAASPGGSSGPNGAGTSPGVTPPPPLRQPPSPRAGGAAEFSFTPHASAAVHRAGGASRGPGTDGLEYLMRTCNHMLKSSMGMPATPLGPPPRATAGVAPEIALDAVGPVLETVLQNLTTEYEKRLLAKDQEFKLGQEAQERMRRDIARLKQEVTHWKEQAAAVKYLPAPDSGLSDAEREALERKIAEEKAAAAAAVAAKEAEVAAKEAQLRAMQQDAEAELEEKEAKLNELSAEVERYQGLNDRLVQMQEENRQLYNTVQDLKGSIRVFCRVRPRGRTGDSSNCMVEIGEEGQVHVFSAKHNKWHPFKFDRVFGEDSSQDEVYAETQPLIRSVLDGYNVCIFAYGQTGSGKTHTMSGTDIGQYAGRGLNYRALDDLFDLNRARDAEVSYAISVQLLEIYNESIRDLLVSDAEAKQQRALQLVNSQRSGCNVPDAIQVSVTCTEEVLAVMERGARNRAVAETKMNDRSSRSHQVLTIIVEGTNKISHARTHGCLHLIDLAGSERVGKSGAEGQQLLEAQHINKSLSALGNVMHALASKSGHIPFRDSKLTQLLQDSLSGQAKTMMFMHVAPEANSVSETLSTLNFGKGVTEITLGAAKKNAESGAAWEAKERAIQSEREKAAAQRALAEKDRALAEEKERNLAMAAEVEALKAQLARMATGGSVGSPCASSDDEGVAGIRAHRPAAARRAAVLTPRSRLAQAGAPAAAMGSGVARLTPRAVGAGDGATPRSGSASQRPQVSRLNLGSGSGSASEPEERRPLGSGSGSGNASVRPPMAKLNLQNLQPPQPLAGVSEENLSPLSARGTPCSARRVSPSASSTNWLTEGSDGSDLSCSEDDSPLRATAGAAPSPRGGAGALQQAGGDDGAFQLVMSPPRPLTARSAAAAAANAGAGAPAAGLAAVARLPLQQLRKSSGGGSGSKLPQAPNSSRIPGPSPSPPTAAARLAAQPSGSLTARPALGRRASKSPTLSGGSSIPRVPLSARESATDAAARRAALQQKAAPAAASNLRRSSNMAPGSTSMRRSASGISETGSSGALSARGVRSSQSMPARRWN
ncbi:hypothetical protein ABPG77_001944 [Micractinium sp. CCAP 211/92]